MKKRIYLFTILILIALFPLHSGSVNLGDTGVSALPKHAIQLDKHRYFYIEKVTHFTKEKNDQLLIKLRVGSDYSLSGSFSLSSPWEIATDSRYLFELRSKDLKKPIKSSGQFDVVRGLNGAKALSIEIKFTIPKDLNMETTHLYFSGKPKIDKGASLILED